MRMQSQALRIVLAAALPLTLAGAPSLADSNTETQPRYAPWNADQQQTQELVKELRALIDEAERSRAANPVFLQDLRDLAARYATAAGTAPATAPVRLLTDTFADGNYTANPAWKVSAGQFRVETSGNYVGLRSTIAAPAASAGSGDLAGAILGAILQQGGASGGDKFASIYTPVKISNAFTLKMDLASKFTGGRLDFGPYQGASGQYAYRIAYFPGRNPGLQLLKVTPQGATAIGDYNNTLWLEDKRRHTIEWKRDTAGAMTVSVDGKTLISATDTSLKDPFSGFLVINSGGDYAIPSIAIDGTP